MNEHVHPLIAAQPHRCWLTILGTPPDEAERVHADIEYLRCAEARERERCERALDLQIRHQTYPGGPA